MTNILAIESSCDETSASIISDGVVLNNIIFSQVIHEKYGGVVPELASRAHQQSIVTVVNKALKDANIRKSDLQAIGFTKGPGLLGSLLVGASFSKAMATALGIPIIEVHHMKAHVLAHFIDDPKPPFPFLCMTVSGGHTQILKVTGPMEMEILGETRDDAVGEAFDKTAKILGLPYPGGPLIDKYAKNGNDTAFDFPRSDIPNLDFSFSGIKTAVLYFVRDRKKENEDFVGEHIEDISASVQKALIDMLMDKLEKASKLTGIKEVAIAGGVAANSRLREELIRRKATLGWTTYIPRFEYCTDNAAMIAMAAHFSYTAGNFAKMDSMPQARLPF